MSRKGPRNLTREEKDLWDKVTARTVPLHATKPTDVIDADGHKRPEVPKKPALEPIPPFRIGENGGDTVLSHNLSPGLSETLSQSAVRMDRESFSQLKRGKKSPQARIDLHGMTLARAHPVLNRFILDAHAKGLRLVLVITGKGKDRDDGGPIPVRRGILKHQVPQWLSTPPLSHVVLQVVEAHLKHGGAGAYYVYLRRQR